MNKDNSKHISLHLSSEVSDVLAVVVGESRGGNKSYHEVRIILVLCSYLVVRFR
jgi:hypothetical protein